MSLALLQGTIGAAGREAWHEAILSAVMPLRSRCSAKALASAFREQYGDAVRLGRAQWAGDEFDEAARAHVTRAIRREAQRWLESAAARAENGEDSEENQQDLGHVQTELLDDAVLLDIVGCPGFCRLPQIMAAPEALAARQSLDSLRRLFREPGARECYTIWGITANTVVSWRSPNVDAGPATAASTEAAPEGLCLIGRHLLGSRWPECSSARGTAPLEIAPGVTNTGASALQQQPFARSRSRVFDMRLASSTPEQCRSRAVRALTRDCQRVYLQAADLHKHGMPVVVAEPAELGSRGADLCHWRGAIDGPPQTAWAGGRFEFELAIDIDRYPEKPPTIQFMTLRRGALRGSCCVFHPNVDARGFVCADVLQTEWSSVCSVATLLMSIQSIMDDPSCEHPANMAAAELLLQNRGAYLKRVRRLARESVAFNFG